MFSNIGWRWSIIAVLLLAGCGGIWYLVDTEPKPVSPKTTKSLPESNPGPEIPTELTSRKHTLRVRAETCDGLAVGSAVAVDETTLVTNRHVVEGATDLWVSTWDGHTVEVAVVSLGVDRDLAVVKTASPVVDTALKMSDKRLEPGSRIEVLGYPDGGKYTASVGKVENYIDGDERGQPGTEVMRVSATVQPGNSGGPVINDSGEVVGVVYGLEVESGAGLVLGVSDLLSIINTEQNTVTTTC